MHEHSGDSKKGNQIMEVAYHTIGVYDRACIYNELDRLPVVSLDHFTAGT